MQMVIKKNLLREMTADQTFPLGGGADSFARFMKTYDVINIEKKNA